MFSDTPTHRLYISHARTLKGAAEGVEPGTGFIDKLFGRKAIVNDLANPEQRMSDHPKLRRSGSVFTLDDDALGGRVASFSASDPNLIQVLASGHPPSIHTKGAAKAVAFELAQSLNANLFDVDANSQLSQADCQPVASPAIVAPKPLQIGAMPSELALLQSFLEHSHTVTGYLRMHGIVPCSSGELTDLEQGTLDYLCADVLELTVFARLPLLDAHGWWAIWSRDSGPDAVVSIEPEGLIYPCAPTFDAFVAALLLDEPLDKQPWEEDSFQDIARATGIYAPTWQVEQDKLRTWAATHGIAPAAPDHDLMPHNHHVLTEFEELQDALPSV